MANLQAARRYAQAAFDLALRDHSVGQWRADLGDVAEVLSRSAAAPVLSDGRIPLERRLGMVDRALDIQPLARNLAKLLVQKGRSGEAAAVADAFNRMADEHEGIAHAEITTAVALEPAQLVTIEQQLSRGLGKRVRATAVINPAIVGGIVVRVGDKLIDGSVRSRLKRLRRELEGAH